MTHGPRRGRLHVWLSYAAGVGETYTVRFGDRPRGEGIGLGLAVAKGFVEAMGGTIELEDTPGGGLTVCIALEAA